MIDCGGVLHHLGDPLAGWSVLRSLLRPGGVMRIALYSELARRHVVAAHRYIAERGYGRTADDIRRFRQDIFALPADHPLRPLAQSPDFFSISDCRDLLFHVQEHRFTVPRIAAFLDDGRPRFSRIRGRSAALSNATTRNSRTTAPAPTSRTGMSSSRPIR